MNTIPEKPAELIALETEIDAIRAALPGIRDRVASATAEKIEAEERHTADSAAALAAGKPLPTKPATLTRAQNEAIESGRALRAIEEGLSRMEATAVDARQTWAKNAMREQHLAMSVSAHDALAQFIWAWRTLASVMPQQDLDFLLANATAELRGRTESGYASEFSWASEVPDCGMLLFSCADRMRQEAKYPTAADIARVVASTGAEA